MYQLTREDLLKHLRDALNHLHDADYLRRSPLATLFGVANRLDTSLALRNILISAIESLKPDDSGPPSPRAWQLYEVLHCHFVQRLTQQVVADQLAVSIRQLRREQRTGLEVLADRLCEQFHLAKPPEVAVAMASSPWSVAGNAAVSEDLAWLKDTLPEEPADYGETLLAALHLVQPLAAQQQVHLDVQTADDLPQLAVHQVALSQILLSLLATVLPQARGHQVRISARAVDWGVQIEVQAQGSGKTSRALSDDALASLAMARQLAEICAGKISVMGEDEPPLNVAVTLPALECVPVLVIDDNADALRLMQRYVTGTRYRLLGTRHPEQALSLAESSAPQVIVLDVMMPQVDGWKVLGRLRQHPRTGHVPIIVCTILPHEALALSLGANAFVRKPVTRRDFLAALDRQVPLPEIEHC